MRNFLFVVLCSLSVSTASAQIGEFRNEFAVGVGGGLVMSTVDFLPEVPQSQYMGRSVGLTLRYTGEKYFNSICAIVAEVNYAQVGWKERIWDKNDDPVINNETGVAEKYSRVLNYVQVPFFARLGWGRERQGVQFFFQAGPQLGYLLGEKAEYNFDLDQPNYYDRISNISGPDITTGGVTYTFSNMYHMDVENKLDYGIAAGLGVELSQRRLGHFMLEGRFYYGLGNIYGNTKRDYFAKSNFNQIVVKATYLFDLVKSKNPKIR